MRRNCAIKGLVAAGCCLAATLAVAEDCKPAAGYRVAETSFARLPLDAAIRRVLVSTPLTVSAMPTAANTKVGAEAVSGPLDQVLDDLMSSTANKWAQDGCKIVVSGQAPLPVTPAPVVDSGGGLRTWTISVADRYIRVTLKRWAKEAGYELVWDVNQDIEVDVDSVIRNKSFDEAFLEVMNSLAISDFPVEAVIYENRVIRIVKLARKD